MCHPDAPSRSAIVVSLLQVIVILPTSMIIGSLVAADAAARAAAPRPVRLEDATTDQRTDASASTTTRLATPPSQHAPTTLAAAASEPGKAIDSQPQTQSASYTVIFDSVDGSSADPQTVAKAPKPAAGDTKITPAAPTTPEIRFNNILAAEEDGSQLIASDGIWKATTPAHMPGTAIVTINWTLNGAVQTPDTSSTYRYPSISPAALGWRKRPANPVSAGLLAFVCAAADRRHRLETLSRRKYRLPSCKQVRTITIPDTKARTTRVAPTPPPNGATHILLSERQQHKLCSPTTDQQRHQETLHPYGQMQPDHRWRRTMISAWAWAVTGTNYARETTAQTGHGSIPPCP